MPRSNSSSADGRTAARSGWQARKSASTRLQIIEATLRCFVRLGYLRTTTPAIVAEAGLSRGAMLHHFPTRLDVVRAAVGHLHARRLKAFRAAVAALPDGSNKVEGVVHAYWAQLGHPLYPVLLELYVAARTDQELAAILAAEDAAFDRELRATGRELIPEWRELGENFELGTDLLICTMEGVALEMIKHPRRLPNRRIRDYLVERLEELAGRSPAAQFVPHGARTDQNPYPET